MSSIYQTIGARIRRARESLKMSQADLAIKLGYQSSTTISYFEAGERKISIQDLQRVARTLGLPLEYFMEEEISPEDAQYLRFRAIQVRPAARDAVVSFLAFTRANGAEPSEILRRHSQHQGRHEPRQVASRLLKEMGIIQAPVSPEAVADYLKVPVYTWDFPDEISGMVVCERSRLCIGVNEAHPKVRQRFSTAHELGHLLLEGEQDMFVDFIGVEQVPHHADEALYLDQEKRANWFAADLLMPAPWLQNDFHEHGADLPLLARKYEVSQQALWFRLLSLKLVDAEPMQDQYL